MKVNVRFPMCIFNIEINVAQLNELKKDLALKSNDFVVTITQLVDQNIIPKMGNTSVADKTIIYYDYSGWIIYNGDCTKRLEPTTSKSLYDALASFLKVELKKDKMYRFVYHGGTRSGEKRAVKVIEVATTYIQAEDLNDGSPKRYNLDKITDLMEIS